MRECTNTDRCVDGVGYLFASHFLVDFELYCQMNNSYLQIGKFLPIFDQAYPFNRLSKLTRRYLTSRLELVRFSPGQLLYSEDRAVKMLYCLVEGQVQVLGSAHHQSPTLTVVGCGTVMGWDSWVRATQYGSARVAGMEKSVLALALRYEHFEKLAVPEILPILSEHLTIAELFQVLFHFVERLPTPIALPDLKELVDRIYQQQIAIAYHVFSCPDVALSSDYLWFMSSNRGIPVGTPIKSLTMLLHQSAAQPLRLVGVERRCLAHALSLASRSHSPILLSR
jgi:hypothetical protein